MSCTRYLCRPEEAESFLRWLSGKQIDPVHGGAARFMNNYIARRAGGRGSQRIKLGEMTPEALEAAVAAFRADRVT